MSLQRNPPAELKQALDGSRLAIGSVVLFSFFVNLLMLTGPLFMLQVYDRVLTSGSVPTLVALSLLVAILYALFGFLDYIRGRILMRVAASFDEKLRDRVFDLITWHAIHKNAEIRTRPTQDLAVIRQFLSGAGPLSFLDLPWMPVYIFVIYLLHSWLGIAATVAALLLVTLAVINNFLTVRHLAKSNEAMQQANKVGEETRRNVEMATVLGMLDRLRLRWQSVIGSGLESQMKASDHSGLITSSTKTLRLIFQSAILGLGAYLAVKQEITAGTMIAASIIMARALAPVEQVVAQWQAFLSARRSWRQLGSLLSETPQPQNKMDLPIPKGHLQVKNLMAFVPGEQSPIVSGISFDLKPGSGLGIIGPTGAGKSTLAKALIGIWPDIRGTARIDKATIDQWDSEALGKFMGYLSQDAELFEGTVADNISRFSSDDDPQAIIKAAHSARVHEMILAWPLGYKTLLGENGVKLSAGQRQRIGLARALYGDPVLLVLDEPNSNLDAEGEAALIAALAETRKRGGTVIVVAHRPSAIAVLDTLMVLKDGKPIAFGPKNEVLKKVLANPAKANGSPSGITGKKPSPKSETEK